MITLKASAILKRIVRARLTHLGVVEWMILIKIAASFDGASTKDISESLGLSGTAILRHTYRFQENQWISVRTEPSRGHARMFSITDLGRALLAVAPETEEVAA